MRSNYSACRRDSIIPHEALFVNRKIKQNNAGYIPKICALFYLTFANYFVIIVSTKGKREKMLMKKFFKIEEPFRLEYNDIRALITVINVVLIMIFGLSIAWFGLVVALIGTIKDLKVDRHINGLVMHLASVALNIYFLILLYCG